MKTAHYKKFNLVCRIEGEAVFFYDIVAVDIEAAMADVVCAYGPCELIQWGVR